MRFFVPIAIIALLTAVNPGHAAPRAAAAKPSKLAKPAVLSLAVSPAVVTLDGKDASQSLLVTGAMTGGTAADLTHAAAYSSTNAKVVRVDAGGVVHAVGDGVARVEIRAGGKTARVGVRIRNGARVRPLNFAQDILPVLSKAGCNGAACHAKQGGKNGFQLSVLAFDVEQDYQNIVKQAAGRRVNRQEPGRSLILLKATLTLPHAGGKRFAVDSPEYRLVARWIAEGAQWGDEAAPTLKSVEVEPKDRVMQPDREQQLQATAVYSDGSRRDVTALADYKSNETAIADVDETGLIKTTKLAGEAAIMVRFMGNIAVSRVAIPTPGALPADTYANLPTYNFIDQQVYRKLRELNLAPSPLCDDATFLRRATLDLIGSLPTPEETRAFLAECDTERGTVGAPPTSGVLPPATKTRARLVDRLLERPEYADYWAMRWVNLLLVDRDPLFPKGAFTYDRWVRDAFRANMPFDQFAHDLVTGAGETYRDGPANFFRALATPVEQSKSLSQLFLGVRIDCAQCHHHPFERWGQDDFYSMAAFFARVRQKGGAEFERIVYTAPDGEVTHPKTGKVMPPKPLGGPIPEVAPGDDRREALARWMTAPENPFFAREIVNRMWGLMLGRGLVEPVDDLRLTNPASNDQLLDALAKDFVDHGYDLKHLLRGIAASAAYQRSSVVTRNNARDTRNYSRFYVKRMVAEVLLDAMDQVTGVQEVFSGHPSGTRAIQMWDNKLPVEFLDVFGRPSRLGVCECDRPADGSITQVLHLMNAPTVQSRLTSDAGLVAKLDASGKPPEEIIRDLYLRAYSRYPRADEMEAAKGAFTRPGATRRQALEDLMWVLLNSPEFVFNH